MTVELLRDRTAGQSDPSLEVSILLSLLGLTLTLALLPLLGSNFGTWMALAG